MGDGQKLVFFGRKMAQNSYFAILMTSLFNNYLWLFYGRTTDFISCFISLSNEFLGNEDIVPKDEVMNWVVSPLPLLNSYFLVLIPKITIFRDWVFREVIKVKRDELGRARIQ